jgi:hypothetical protein
MNDSKRASGVAAQPARKRPFRAHIACGANLALESAGDLGEARPATEEFPGSPGYADPPLWRVLLIQDLGVAASRRKGRTRGRFRALCESAPGFCAEQPGRNNPVKSRRATDRSAASNRFQEW